MLRIGIDIDDTLTNTSELLTEMAYKYDKDYSNNNHVINNIPALVRGLFDDEILNQFYIDHVIELGNNVKVKEDAKEVIDKLISEGHEIIFITARSEKFYPDTENFNKEYLKINNIKYNKLICGQTYKIETCKKENIDIMFDDAVDTCESLNKNNIKAVVFTSSINKQRETKCDRVSSWNELYTYVNNFIKK